ncbi:uncharacterized protein J3D65DRAFT_153974 [Phyllosticta citribraziliensis]|uniref:Uncharacterized protein n=1 Tax=Phyllosticta citribraziliensis TaxID=989973 RepID=A0ABR1L9M5_9PEZI
MLQHIPNRCCFGCWHVKARILPASPMKRPRRSNPPPCAKRVVSHAPEAHDSQHGDHLSIANSCAPTCRHVETASLVRVARPVLHPSRMSSYRLLHGTRQHISLSHIRNVMIMISRSSISPTADGGVYWRLLVHMRLHRLFSRASETWAGWTRGHVSRCHRYLVVGGVVLYVASQPVASSAILISLARLDLTSVSSLPLLS